MCVGAYQSSGGFAPITSAQEKGRWHQSIPSALSPDYIGVKKETKKRRGERPWVSGNNGPG